MNTPPPSFTWDKRWHLTSTALAIEKARFLGALTEKKTKTGLTEKDLVCVVHPGFYNEIVQTDVRFILSELFVRKASVDRGGHITEMGIYHDMETYIDWRFTWSFPHPDICPVTFLTKEEFAREYMGSLL